VALLGALLLAAGQPLADRALAGWRFDRLAVPLLVPDLSGYRVEGALGSGEPDTLSVFLVDQDGDRGALAVSVEPPPAVEDWDPCGDDLSPVVCERDGPGRWLLSDRATGRPERVVVLRDDALVAIVASGGDVGAAQLRAAADALRPVPGRALVTD